MSSRHLMNCLSCSGVLLLAGCSLARQEQVDKTQQTIVQDNQRTITEIPAMTVTTVAGDITIPPARIVQTHEAVKKTEQKEVTKSQSEATPQLSPEGKALAQQVLSAGLSGGALGWLAGAVGVVTTAMRHFAAVKAEKVAKQTVRGVENAKGLLGDKWNVLVTELHKAQDEDVRVAVNKQTKGKP